MLKTTQIKVTSAWNEYWQSLTRLLELGDGFYLIFVLTDESQTVDFLRQQLHQKFRCAHIATPPAATEQLYYDVMQGLTTHINATSAAETEVIIIDLHRYLVNEPMKVLLARLNERREWLRNGLKVPLILILSPHMDVGRYAPDFWSVRDLVLFLDNSLIHKKNLTYSDYIIRNPVIILAINIWRDIQTQFIDWNKNSFEKLSSSLHHTINSFQYLIRYISDWACGIEQRYLQQIIYEHRVFNIKGLCTRGEYNIELEQVFVELRIAPTTAPDQPHRELFAMKELQGNQPIWEFLRYSRRHYDQVSLAIIGAPGSGKTTLLRHIALSLASNSVQPYFLVILKNSIRCIIQVRCVRRMIQDIFHYFIIFLRNSMRCIIQVRCMRMIKNFFRHPVIPPKLTPILLFLRQHVKTILAERPALADLLQQHFSDSKRYPNLQPPKQWFQRQLNAGNCLILLDGLDEVANAEERQQISTWIDEQTVNYPLCPFVVTSRPQGYHAAPLSRATIVLEVQAFTTAQVNQFIKSWYLATEIMSFGGKDDPGVRHRAEQEAEDLQQRLQARPALQALTVNPLLLTMIAMVHRYRGQLPGRRVELYAEICDVLLGHWREAKGIQDSLTAAQKRVALQPLAAWMMEHEAREIEISKALEVIAEPLNMLGVTDGQVFLEEIEASSGLFSAREMNVWSFAHLTFQEYLAAAHYKDQKIHGNWWHRKVTDSWWQETLLLYAAQADATPIVKSCLGSQNLVALTLAAECLEEALQLDAAVRQQVETLLIANLESDHPELFKLTAEVKLQRRLRNLHRIDEKREIDRTFISCAEYQLFLDEMRAQDDFYQPDHWTTFRFPKNSATQPIAGVRAQDAEKFCKWLSKKENKKYRCPTFTEAQEFSAIDNHALATWCGEKYDWDLQWNSPKTKQNLELKLKQLFKESWIMRYIVKKKGAAALDLNLDRCRALVHDLARATARALVLIIPARDHARLARVLGINDEILQICLENKDFSSAQHRLQQLRLTKHREQRSKNLLAELLIILTTNNFVEQRQAWRRYVGYLAEYSVIGYEMLEKERYTWWQRILFWLKVRSYAKEKEIMAEIYAWAKIVEARQKEGAEKLPAWEGIRIVRERDV